MYQSLYRKYRPTNFDEVVGQEVVVQTLKNAILKNSINHAYLFTGPRGTGKTSVAKIFAKTVNCESLKGTSPCNNCVNCTQTNNKQTIDIIEIDAASNNGVDEIRELRSKASLVPATGKYKVYIIDEVHMLTTGAFNALLKTLEEPPAHIIFILATTEPHKIPATILSRCQRFDFKKIAKQKMVDRLSSIAKEEKINADDLVYQEIADLSDGCMRDALSILDQVIAYAGEKITIDDVHEVNGSVSSRVLINFFQSILDKNYESTFAIIDEYDNQGKNFVKLTEEMLLLLRNVMLLKTIPNYDFEETKKEEYQKLVSQLNVKQVLDYIKKINESLVDMKKTNNVKIMFEMMVVQLLNDSETEGKIEKQSQQTTNTQDNKKKIIPSVQKEEEIEEPKQENIEIKAQPETEPSNINEKQEKIPIQKMKKIENIRNIRINNTLCNFDKKVLLEMKKRIDEVRNLLINPDFSEASSIILDGKLKAASESHLIFVYKTKRMETEFNQNILKIDMLLKEAFQKDYKAIAVAEDLWEKIKEEFNGKKKKYTFLEEPEDLELYLGTSEEDETYIDNMFGDIVEYN